LKSYHQNNRFDIVFIGLGAGNSLLLLSLIKNNLLIGKKVAVIDIDKKNSNDKTYCFWDDNDAPIVLNLQPIISHSYNHIQFTNKAAQPLNNQSYFYIKSIDLYNFIKLKLQQQNIPFYEDTIASIEKENEYFTLTAKENIYTANQIFDSRLQQSIIPKNDDIFLNQSFYGLQVALKKELFLPNVFEIMNFNVAQNGYTQFVYTLPFSATEALIEMTRFGKEKLTPTEGKNLLDQYIKTVYGDYEVVCEEVGCIPMTTIKYPISKFNGILHTGAGANLIKPSTGYGFKNMFYFAEKASLFIKKNGFSNISELNKISPNRFAFYDRLLLIILLKWTKWGKTIFEALFKTQKIDTVLKFLDEKTTIVTEIKIFAKLPLTPFLKAVFIYLKNNNYVSKCLSILLIINYFLLNNMNAQVVNYYSYTILIIGMLLIGLPHGAVDHLLLLNKKFSLKNYILKYLLVVLVYFALWQIMPLISLVLFLVYSAFHFGESEIEELDVNFNAIKQYVVSFLLGAAILLFIISTHLVAALQIINSIKGINLGSNFLSFIFKINPYISYSSITALILFSTLFTKRSLWFLIIMLLISTQTNLLFAFGSYFIFFHSANAWHQLKTKLSLNNFPLYKNALPFTLGALLIFIFIGGYLYFINPNKIEIFEAVFYVFIACISLPHVVLMHFFYKNYKLEQNDAKL
jgi:lycopene beta-cyclase